jgi:NADPH:quinone reductase-like Zn-dependent oxidoreductase
MSRHVVATAYGGPEVLKLESEELPDPGPGQALIEVRAAGVNPYDWKSYSGRFGSDPEKLPIRIGSEASGIVVAVGPDTSGPAGPVSAGDEVIVYRASGAYAERLLVSGDIVIPKPDELSFEQAAGLMLTGVTAVHCLTATAVEEGDTVLIHAASGGVGLMAVQLARAAGARVIGTASESNHDRLRDLGAEPVTYGAGLTERVREMAPDGVDAALDLVGTDEAIDVSLELVSDRRRIATIAGFQRGQEEGIQLLGGGPGADPGTDIRTAARMQLVEAVSNGRLQVFVAGSYALERVAEAHRDIMEGHTNGKLVLVP